MSQPTLSPAGPAPGPGRATDWDAQIERQIRTLAPRELADLAWSLVRRVPEVYNEFRDRLITAEGTTAQLVADAEREIRRVTAIPIKQHHWDRHGVDADYSRVKQRFERLVEIRQPDEVVALGRLFIQLALPQVNGCNDEGEAITEFADCLAVVFGAVMRSSLSGPERLLYAIDATLGDYCDATDEALAIVLDAPATKLADWSAIADTLTGRLPPRPIPKKSSYGGEPTDPDRETQIRWITRALGAAGRADEVDTLQTTEARATGNYERLVNQALQANRLDQAEAYAREGLAAATQPWSGQTEPLIRLLGVIAGKRARWDVVAAHAARMFFHAPSRSTFADLIKAAEQAQVAQPVRAVAMRFLTTGVQPFRVIKPPPVPARPKGSRKKGPPPQKVPLPDPKTNRLEIDTDWPLPIPDYLIPHLHRLGAVAQTPQPHWDTLLALALAAKQPEEALRWFDKLRAAPARPGFVRARITSADEVAALVAATHPEQAIGIYQAALDTHLPNPDGASYAAASGYLKKLRPLYDALNRSDEWTALVASIRIQYKTRKRFLEILNQLDDSQPGGPIPSKPS